MTEAESKTAAAEAPMRAEAGSFEPGFIESFNCRYPTFILETLLCDRTTGRNIIWADNEYEALGEGYMADEEITIEKILDTNFNIIKPRFAKERDKQSQRTKSRAEVFTPSWLCNQMNNDLDAMWFGRRDVFNAEITTEAGAKTWRVTSGLVAFPETKGRGWRAYIEAPQLEIACGEAPFVCSRYDAVTGDDLPVCERVGFLDRKLRIVTERTKTRKEWVRRALDALRATYGFEYQGDNLLIARINVLETFAEHLRNRWGTDFVQGDLEQAAWIVSWNFWQMNGLTDAVPTSNRDAEVRSTFGTFEEPKPLSLQPSLFDLFGNVFSGEMAEETNEKGSKDVAPLCVIYDWQNGKPFEFVALKDKARTMKNKFYAVIGNPPYQESSAGEKKADASIYHYFMNTSYDVAERAELITPARFLFDNGNTPKSWNRKMLSDEHFKVLCYVADSSTVFSNTDIKGGIVISYHDIFHTYEPIVHFTQYPELNSILAKVQAYGESSIVESIFNQSKFNLQALYSDYPQLKEKVSSDGCERRLTSACFNFECFKSEPNNQIDECRILGKTDNERLWKYLDRKYVDDADSNLWGYKVIIPANNGSGELGEAIASPIVAKPGDGFTQTFISFGNYSNIDEAEAMLKYLKTKVCRTLLGILKITQNGKKPVWKFVPLQDFTSHSNIDWSQSIADIDSQLYAKYGLDDDEIAFIESHAKEMD